MRQAASGKSDPIHITAKKDVEEAGGRARSLLNGKVFALGRILNKAIPDNWLRLLGSVRHIGEDTVQAFESKETGLAVKFHDYLLEKEGTKLPELLADLFIAARSKAKWEECPDCSGKGFRWRILRCSRCHGKGGWISNSEEGAGEDALH